MRKLLALVLALMMLTAALPALATGATGTTETPTEEPRTEETQVSAEDAALTEADNQNLNASYTRVINALKAEDYEAAKEYISICFAYCDRQSNPVYFADLLLKRACIDVIEKKTDMALMNLAAALRVRPDMAEAYYIRMQIYNEAGETDLAIRDVEKYIELSQDSAAYNDLALLQEAKGDYEAAQAAFEKFAQANGATEDEINFQNAVYQMRAGKLEEAITAFEAYTGHETLGSGALFYIGACKLDLADYAGAAEAFTACEEKGGIYEGLYYYRGLSYYYIAKYAEAEADFTKSLEAEPTIEDAEYYQALCKLYEGDYEAAKTMLTAYIDKQAAAAEAGNGAVNYGAYFYRALCRRLLEDTEGAVADYTTCIENGFELRQSYYERAALYEKLGDTEKPNADLDSFLKLSNP